VETYHDEFGLPYTILRYGSLYGRRADPGNGIHRMIHSALTEGKIRYMGTGEELREYIHVEDAAKLSVDILKPEFANQHITLTGHHPMRVKDIMEMLREIMGSKVKLECENSAFEGHYNITPYQYHPRVGKKLVSSLYTDMGQGLIDCLAEIRAQLPVRASARPKKAKRA
jgi:UDP-glucose 4-epimerase